MLKRILAAAYAVPRFAWPLVLAFFVSLPVLWAHGSGPVLGRTASAFWGRYFLFTLLAMILVGLAGVLAEHNRKNSQPKPPAPRAYGVAVLLLAAVTPTAGAWVAVGLLLAVLVAVVASQLQEQRARQRALPRPQALGYLSYYGEDENAAAEYYKAQAAAARI